MMKKRIHKDDIDKLKWTDLGNHAYYHWLHERGFVSEFNELCYKSADVILDTLSDQEKNMIHQLLEQMRINIGYQSLEK